VNDAVDASRAEHRGEHADAVAVCSGNFVLRKWPRFRAHYYGIDVGSNLNNAVYAASEVFGFWPRFPAGFRQVLVTDAVVFQQLSQHSTIKLRPSRPRNAADIAEKFDVVLP